MSAPDKIKPLDLQSLLTDQISEIALFQKRLSQAMLLPSRILVQNQNRTNSEHLRLMLLEMDRRMARFRLRPAKERPAARLIEAPTSEN